MKAIKEQKATHEEALKRFESIHEQEKEQRELAIEDMLFVHSEDGQWDDNAKESRKNRPRYTINRVAGALDQIIGDQRQNRTDIKVVPDSGGADEDTAKTFDGLIRSIESRSAAADSYDNGFEEALGGGFGGWRISHEYTSDESFDQEILIKPILSAASSLWFDTNAKKYDKSDGTHAFITENMSEDAFKAKYPEAQITGFDNGLSHHWHSNSTIRVAEYWRKVPIVKDMGLLSDGRVIDLNEEASVIDELAASGVTVEKKRKANCFKVESYIMSGVEIIKGPMVWAGKYIPLIPCYGKVNHVESKTFIRGMVRNSKDPQRIYNYSKSAEIEAVALTPKDPYWMTKKQAEGHQDQLSNFNKRNDPFMFYKADTDAPGPPQRTGAPSVQSALIQQSMAAREDIHATTGIEPASLGNSPELKSGKAIIAQQKMGDRGSFNYADNLKKSIQYTGRILIDLIPKIYDTDRIVRVLKVDGTTEEVQLNQTVIDQKTQQEVVVNDLSLGQYTIKVNTGPAYATQRQESAQQLIDLSTGNETFAQLATDLIAKNLDLLEGEELTSRVRKLMITQGIVEPTEEEAQEMGLNEPKQPDPQETALVDNVNMQTAKLQADIEQQDAKTASETIKAQIIAIDGYKKLVEALKAQQDAGIPITGTDMQTLDAQQGIIEVAQDNTQI